MSKNKMPSKKIRILQREDGAVFTHTAQLEIMPTMRPGWKLVYADGKSEIVLDKATAQQLDPNTVSQREQTLIEENATLREQLAQAQGMINSPVTAPAAAPLQPGETPLPPDGPTDLTQPGSVDEGTVQFAPEPKMIAPSNLKRMGDEKLKAYAKELNNEVVIPDDADKDALVELCIAQQEIYKAKVTANG